MKKQQIGDCPFLLIKQDPKGKCSNYLAYNCYLNPKRGLLHFIDGDVEHESISNKFLE